MDILLIPPGALTGDNCIILTDAIKNWKITY